VERQLPRAQRSRRAHGDSRARRPPLCDLWADPRGNSAEDTLREFLAADRSLPWTSSTACCSLSEAGRTLFGASRGRKASTNDADRLRKYLNRFGIEWSQLAARR
jgi:sigma54-dependent transcription regulator